MDRYEAIENRVAADAEADSSAYVPTLQLTKGQPPPFAANGGPLSYMSFDRDGDAGTTAAIEAALKQIADGEGQALIDRIENAPPGPIETEWGLGFREYEECLDHIRANGIEAPEGGLALPLRYTVHEQPSYSIVPSNALWRDPARRDRGGAVAQGRRGQRAAIPLLPAGDARRAPHRGVLPRSLGPAAPNAWTSSAFRWRTSNRSARTSMTRRRWNACSTRRSRSSSWSSSRMRPMRSSTTTTSSTRTTRATARKTRTPGTRA